MLTIFYRKTINNTYSCTTRYWFNTNKTLKIYGRTYIIDKMKCNINDYENYRQGANTISYIDKK